MPRNQRITKIELSKRKDGRPVVRYQIVVDAGVVDGIRKQVRKRFKTEAEARAALAKINDQRATGTYVLKSKDTVEQAVENYLRGRTGIKPSSLASLRDYLKPVVDVYGDKPIQSLKKSHIDSLLLDLELGTLPARRDGQPRRKYGAFARRHVLSSLRMVLESELKQGHLVRNVASLVDVPKLDGHEMQTFDVEQAQQLLQATVDDRDGIAWHLGLAGLRRAEIAGLLWSAVDMNAHTLSIKDTRVTVDGHAVASTTKTTRSTRTLPLPDSVYSALLHARTLQARDRVTNRDKYQDSGYVVVDECGSPYRPDRITKAWRKACIKAKVPTIRLHDARHTCATLMHLQGVPIVVIAAWLGHVDAGFTMRTYAHSQNDSLKLAAESFPMLVTIPVTQSAEKGV